ncbi:MAG: CHAT domain-containing protein [Bacteroidetes bacterium]|nr:CHAT domain-containing protein [Bacteroidota bacterium]
MKWSATYLVILLLFLSTAMSQEITTGQLFKTASEYIDQEYTDSASFIYTQLLENSDQNPDVHFRSFTGLVHVASFHSQYATADSLLAEADQFFERHKNDISLSSLLTYLQKKAEVARFLSRYEDALQIHKDVLEKSSQLNPPDEELNALAYIYVAATYEDMTQHESAREYGEQGYKLCRNIYEADDMRMLTPNSIMAVVYMRLNSFDSSFVYYNRAIHILNEKVEEPGAQLALLYGNLGATYNEYGDYAKGLENLEKARSLNIKLGENEGLGYNLYGLGTTYYFLGDYGRAREYMNACLAVRKKVYPEGHHMLISPKEVIGIAEYEIGNYDKGMALMIEVLNSRIETYGEHSLPVAYTTENIALSFYDVGQADTALGYMDKALSIYRDFFPENNTHFAQFYFNQAKIYLANNILEPALAAVVRSSENYRNSGSISDFFIAQNDVVKGQILAAMGSFDLAEKSYSSAFKTFGGHPLEVKNAETLITDAATRNALSSYLEFQYQQKKQLPPDELASRFEKISELGFELSDKLRRQYNDPYTKGMMMRNGSASNRLGIGLIYNLYRNNGVNKYLHSLFRYAEYGRANLFRDMIDDYKIKAFAGISDSLMIQEQEYKQELGSKNMALAEDPTNAKALQDLFETKESYNDFVESLHKEHPQYHALKYQSSIVSLKAVQDSLLLDGQAILEYVLDDTAYYVLVITPDEIHILHAGNKKVVDGDLSHWVTSITRLDMDGSMKAGSALYSHLLSPVESLIQAGDLIIVPSGNLFNLSFEALNRNINTSSFAIYKYNISYALSVNTLAEQMRSNGSVGENPVIVAPGFESSLKDQYLEQLGNNPEVDSSYLLAVRQPWSRKMANTLARKFNGKALVDQEATESKVRSSIVDGGVLHFATHAVADHNDPLRSKFILAKDDKTHKNDGYLHAYEIFDLSLRSELAILTACESGKGAQRDGEGMISLAYSINYAGCPSVIMSLWKIDEKVNNHIVEDFYGLLKKGMDKSDALRKAKRNYLLTAEGNLQHPFYWSGLVVMGDPGPVQLSSGGIPQLLWLLLLGLLFGVIVIAARFRFR